MAGQLPIVAFFVIKWLPRNPQGTLRLLALQATGVMVSCAAVFYLT